MSSPQLAVTPCTPPHPATSPISLLPPELLLRVFAFLADTRSLISAAKACRSFHDQIFDVSADKYIWKAAAREACGFGGAVHGIDLGDIDYSLDGFVGGGIPEVMGQLWGMTFGPTVVDVKSRLSTPVSAKGKEREQLGQMEIEVKPLYRDLCKAQFMWEGLAERAVKTRARQPLPEKLPLTPEAERRRSRRLSMVQTVSAMRAARDRYMNVLGRNRVPSRSPSSKESNASTISYGRPDPYLPPLTPPADPTTHFTQRVFSIAHAAPEAGRTEPGPPIVNTKISSWAECLEEYPLAKTSTTFSLSTDSENTEDKREDWGRRIARGGPGSNLAFLVFSDDPRTFSDRQNSRGCCHTVRRAVIGGYFGRQPVVEDDKIEISKVWEKNEVIEESESAGQDIPQTSNTGPAEQSNDSSAADAAKNTDTVRPLSIEQQIKFQSDRLRKIRIKSEEHPRFQRYFDKGLGKRKSMESKTTLMNETEQPYMRQASYFSPDTREFIRPTPRNTIFPPLKRHDITQTLKTNVSELFPDVVKAAAARQESSGGQLNSFLDSQTLHQMGFTPREISRWLKATIHSDANLNIIPELRKHTMTGARDGSIKYRIEAAAVERLAVDPNAIGSGDSTLPTVINMRWILPKKRDSLSIKPPPLPPPAPPPQVSGTAPSTWSLPGSIAFIGGLAFPILPVQHTPNTQSQGSAMDIAANDIANQILGDIRDAAMDRTWEFRSRGPYLVACDDNNGTIPSTISCFRARSSSEAPTDSDMGDLLWQRLMIIPFMHHREGTRHTKAAEIRSMAQAEELMHEWYQLDNDGLKLTTSTVVYACRKHIVSASLISAYRRNKAQQAASSHGKWRAFKKRKTQTKEDLDPWGIGTAGSKAVAEFWVLNLENGHTIKILSLREEEREVPPSWCGWTSWDVTDAGGVIATIGGWRDADKWRQAMKRVDALHRKQSRTFKGQDGESQVHDSKIIRKHKKLGKSKRKGKASTKKPTPKSTRQEDDDEWSTASQSASDNSTLGDSGVCTCSHCITQDTHIDSDFDFDDSSVDESDVDPAWLAHDDYPEAVRERYGHPYVFFWDFKIRPGQNFNNEDRVQLIPLPSRNWTQKGDPYVSVSPCSRYIAISSKYRLALWDLTQDGKLECWKVPKKDIRQWKHAGWFDPIHNRQYYATASEEQDDMECQPYNGVWLVWEDVAIPHHWDPTSQSRNPSQISLRKGVAFINSIDLRRYVDGIDYPADINVRKIDYLNTLLEMTRERESELRRAGTAIGLPHFHVGGAAGQFVGGGILPWDVGFFGPGGEDIDWHDGDIPGDGDSEYEDEEMDDDDEDDEGEEDDGDPDWDEETTDDDDDHYHTHTHTGPPGTIPGDLWAGLAMLHETFLGHPPGGPPPPLPAHLMNDNDDDDDMPDLVE